MTKRWRTEVVEALRCSADLAMSGRTMMGISTEFGSPDFHFFDETIAARNAVTRSTPDECVPITELSHTKYAALLLEAAQRVEDGEWP